MVCQPTSRASAICLAALLLIGAGGSPAAADHLSAAQVHARIAAAPGTADLSGLDMSGDDLSGLDLSGANLSHAALAGANLHGVKLVGADLSGANLAHADLTETWIMRAKFDGADLHGAILQVVITSDGMDNKPETAASFVGANLSDTSATVHFSDDNMRGANFTNTRMSVVLANQSMGMLRSEFVDTELAGAKFHQRATGPHHLRICQAARRGIPRRRSHPRRFRRRRPHRRRLHRRQTRSDDVQLRNTDRRQRSRHHQITPAAAQASSNSSVSFCIMVPPNSSASTMVTARR